METLYNNLGLIIGFLSGAFLIQVFFGDKFGPAQSRRPQKPRRSRPGPHRHLQPPRHTPRRAESALGNGRRRRHGLRVGEDHL